MTETLRFQGSDSQGNASTYDLAVPIATQPLPYDVLIRNDQASTLLAAIASGGPNTRFGLEGGPNPFRVSAAGAFKDGQSFFPVGPDRPRITGAAVMASWQKDGTANRYYTPWTLQARDNIIRNTSGLGDTVCEIYADGSNSCFDRDRLYVNGARATQVFSIAAGDAGTGHRYFLDRGAGRVYTWTNPVGNVLEITKTPAFVALAPVDGVTFRGIAFDRFASPLQRSGISVAGDEWTFDDVDFQHMNSGGLHLSNVANTQVLNSRFYENGQAGILSGSTVVRPDVTTSNNLIDGCTLTRCNVEARAYKGDWEAAGIKTTDDAGLTVRNTTITGTRGVGLWCDYGAKQLWEDVTIDGAEAQAARLEVAKSSTVRRLTVRRSGRDIGEHYKAVHTNWATVMDTAALAISESQDVLVEDCSVDWDAPVTQADASLNGIIVNVRPRQDTLRVTVRNNRVQMRATPIPTGAAGTSTVGTMVAGGVLVNGTLPAAWSSTPASYCGPNNPKAVAVYGNEYRHGDPAVPRFTYLRSAGDRTAYLTPAQYATANPADATKLQQ